jgi:uncharacterized protein YkwD
MPNTTPRSRRVAVAIALVVATALFMSWSPVEALTFRDHNMHLVTNESRTHHGVRRVDLNQAMSELARKHSLWMANHHCLCHTHNPASVYLRGVRWSIWGENVGWTTGTAWDVEQLFMNSPPHRANILNRRFTHVAVGAVRANDKLWVTVFFYG